LFGNLFVFINKKKKKKNFWTVSDQKQKQKKKLIKVPIKGYIFAILNCVYIYLIVLQ